MGMRLLPKSEIDKRKQEAQKQAVDEGVKLARRVDNLRETAAEEETKLEEFRKRTVERIQKEISQYTEERNSLKKEVEDYEKRRKEALKPVTEEWKEVNNAKLALKEACEQNERWSKSLEEEEAQIRIAKKEADDSLKRITTKESSLTTELKEADSARKEAKRLESEAKKLHQDTTKWAEELEKEVLHREAECAAGERGVILKQRLLDKQKEELADGWKLLEDRKAAFERRIKRAN